MSDDDGIDPFADLPVIDAPELSDVPPLAGASELETFRQVATKLDPRLRRPLSRWRLIVDMLRNPEAASRDLAERLSAWPSPARRHLIYDPNSSAEVAERHERAVRGHRTTAARRAAREAALADEAKLSER